MENKKLEDHKIDEGELENVAGGYDVYKLPFSSKTITSAASMNSYPRYAAMMIPFRYSPREAA